VISGIWQRVSVWLKTWLVARKTKPQPYIDHRITRPSSQKISCESQMRSSTGPLARNTRGR
jgi:hypothetical protein